jgi:DNA-binding GntR family transcriptional regulator
MVRYYKAGRRSDYFRLNQRIHNTVIVLAKNDVLTDSHQSLMTRIRRARYQAIMSQERWDQSVQEHEDLLAALEARDGSSAGAILRAHVLETGEAVRPAAAAEPQESGKAA